MSVRWSEEQFAKYMRRGVLGTTSPPFMLPANQAGAFALGRLPTGTMNKTEQAYDAYLQALKHTGDVLWHKFEGVKLRLADATFYTPDFAVLPSSGVLEMHEVKGFLRDDANVKIKVAASIYPFRFKMVRRKGSGWTVQEIGS